MPLPPSPPVPQTAVPLSGPVSLVTPPRINVAQYVRNGLVPHASFETTIGASVNFLAGIRLKELFRWTTPLASIPTSDASTRTRWRFAAHTSPLHGRVLVTMLCARQNSGDPIYSPSVTLTITNANESVTYGSATFKFGASNAAMSAPSDVPSEFGVAELVIEGVPADTHVYGKFTESECGRIVAATVYEEALPMTAANGYALPSQVAVQSPIYADRRQDMLQLARLMWKRQGSHLLNWTVDNQASPQTTTSGTAKNIISLGTGGPADPSWRIDTQYCGTRARPNQVPCVLAVYGSITSVSGPEAGGVSLSGANSGTIDSVAIASSTPQWYTLGLNLEATVDDYYIEFSNTDASPTETVSVYAVSLFMYEA